MALAELQAQLVDTLVNADAPYIYKVQGQHLALQGVLDYLQEENE